MLIWLKNHLFDTRNMLDYLLITKGIVNLQTGQETDFVLVSCTGSGIEPTRREQVLRAKRVSSSSKSSFISFLGLKLIPWFFEIF